MEDLPAIVSFSDNTIVAPKNYRQGAIVNVRSSARRGDLPAAQAGSAIASELERVFGRNKLPAIGLLMEIDPKTLGTKEQELEAVDRLPQTVGPGDYQDLQRRLYRVFYTELRSVVNFR